MLFLEVVNPSEKTVKVSAVEIKWKKHKFVFFRGIGGTVKFPFELLPGDSAIFWIPMEQVVHLLKEQGCRRRETVKACFRTAVGSDFISKGFVIKIEKWSKSE